MDTTTLLAICIPVLVLLLIVVVVLFIHRKYMVKRKQYVKPSLPIDFLPPKVEIKPEIFVETSSLTAADRRRIKLRKMNKESNKSKNEMEQFEEEDVEYLSQPSGIYCCWSKVIELPTSKKDSQELKALDDKDSEEKEPQAEEEEANNQQKTRFVSQDRLNKMSEREKLKNKQAKIETKVEVQCKKEIEYPSFPSFLNFGLFRKKVNSHRGRK